ncbi:MAG: DsbA family protein [Verrucomicrobiota bacterium]|nr:DsbA family protein [Verrucomicrobiota bacterium]
MKRSLPFALILAVLLIAAAAGTALYRYRLAQVPPIPRNLAAGKPGAVPPHVRGSTNAPVSVEEFGDYECLPCSVAFSTLNQIEKDYGKRVSFTFRQYPLTMHVHGLDAARAAEAAGLQGKFWPMHEALFQNRAVWTKAPDVPALFNAYAASVGLDLAKFKADLAGAEVAKRIGDDQERAASIGVDRTPVVFVNGRNVPFPSLTVGGLHAEIDKELHGKTK